MSATVAAPTAAKTAATAQRAASVSTAGITLAMGAAAE